MVSQILLSIFRVYALDISSSKFAHMLHIRTFVREFQPSFRSNNSSIFCKRTCKLLLYIIYVYNHYWLWIFWSKILFIDIFYWITSYNFETVNQTKLGQLGIHRILVVPHSLPSWELSLNPHLLRRMSSVTVDFCMENNPTIFLS